MLFYYLETVPGITVQDGRLQQMECYVEQKKLVCFTSACNTLLLKSELLLLLDENEIFLVVLIASSFCLLMVLCSVPLHHLFPCVHRRLIFYTVSIKRMWIVNNSANRKTFCPRICKLYFVGFFAFFAAGSPEKPVLKSDLPENLSYFLIRSHR